MIGWTSIAYGAALSAAAAALAVAFLLRERRSTVIASAGVAAAGGALAWNAILHDAGGHRFFVDAPVVVFPVSWQDTGSGVFATAAAALILGFGSLRDATARRLVRATLACGLAALVVDVYLY